MLGGSRLGALGLGDEDLGTLESSFHSWSDALLSDLLSHQHPSETRYPSASLAAGVPSPADSPSDGGPSSAAAVAQSPLSSPATASASTVTAGPRSEVGSDEEGSEGYASSDSDDEGDGGETGKGVADIEDLAGALKGGRAAAAATAAAEPSPSGLAAAENGPKEMLTPVLRASLSKQGYKLIGNARPTSFKGSHLFLLPQITSSTFKVFI